MQIVRDNKWLLYRLGEIWDRYFPDISQDNPVVIRFGRYSKFRLGSIKLDRRHNLSLITITSMFKNPQISQSVIDHTIAHELVHYTHGFSSQRKRLLRYPHAGGVVKREMTERGLGHLYKAYRDWIKEYKQSLALRTKKILSHHYYG